MNHPSTSPMLWVVSVTFLGRCFPHLYVLTHLLCELQDPVFNYFLLHLMPQIPQTQHDPNKIHDSHPPTSHTSSSHVPSFIDLVIHVRSVASSMEPSFPLPLSNQSSIIFLKIPRVEGHRDKLVSFQIIPSLYTITSLFLSSSFDLI